MIEEDSNDSSGSERDHKKKSKLPKSPSKLHTPLSAKGGESGKLRAKTLTSDVAQLSQQILQIQQTLAELPQKQSISDDMFREKFVKFLEEYEESMHEMMQPLVDEAIQELAEQVDQNMDFVEQKLDVFNKALDLQAANIDQSLDVKDRELQQNFSDLKLQIEAEFKKRTRSQNDYALERSKLFKNIEEIEDKVKDMRALVELTGETLGVILETSLI